MADRILYVQYSDAAAYPPLEHSSEIFAERGWDVLFLGVDRNHILKLPTHPRIRVKNLSGGKSRVGQGLQYFTYGLWLLYTIYGWRPRWIYASDPLVLPALRLIKKFTRTPVLYHEHDAPNVDPGNSRFMKLVLASRKKFARQAELCVLPQELRLIDFVKETGRTGPTLCVWNCPRVGEVLGNHSDRKDCLIVYYHGSINRARLPPELVIAASRFKGAVRIRIAGYEAPGSAGYVRDLMDLAESHGDGALVEFLGTINRKSLLPVASKAHVGVSFMPKAPDDINLEHMVGASNKPFDYMACGLPLLVTNLPEWISTFVAPGYGRACDPNDVDSIASELRWYLDHPAERQEMGQRCVQQIKEAWNYDLMFSMVVDKIESARTNGAVALRRIGNSTN